MPHFSLVSCCFFFLWLASGSLTLHQELQLHFAERFHAHVGSIPLLLRPICVRQVDGFGGEILQHQLKYVDTNFDLARTEQ